MPSTRTPRRAASAALVAVVLALLLAACGGASSKTTGTRSVRAPAGTAVPGRAPGAFGALLEKLRGCVQRNGIQLPAGESGAGLAALLRGGPQHALPKGVTRAEYEGVLKKCGGLPLLRGGTRGFGRVQSPKVQEGLRNFAACMRAEGIKVGTPNTSGNGPILDTQGLDRNSAKFRAASRHCASKLQFAFRRAPGAPGG